MTTTYGTMTGLAAVGVIQLRLCWGLNMRSVLYGTAIAIAAMLAENGVAQQLPSEARASSGTGFFVSSQGHILSNSHVVNGCSELHIRVVPSGTERIFIVAQDQVNDLAL